MKQTFSEIPKAALNLIFPLYCQGCETPLEYDNNFSLCQKCFEKLSNPAISSCTSGEGLLFIKRAYHCCQYDGLIKELIHKFKYNKKIFLKNAFIGLLHNLFITKMVSEKIDIVMPVPMHRADERKRGFNQSAILAKGLSEKINTAFENTLIKSKITRAQAGLKRTERLNNIKNAFSCKEQSCFHDKCILVIDDVFTTGATINECARTLNLYGASSILALTLAKGT